MNNRLKFKLYSEKNESFDIIPLAMVMNYGTSSRHKIVNNVLGKTSYISSLQISSKTSLYSSPVKFPDTLDVTKIAKDILVSPYTYFNLKFDPEFTVRSSFNIRIEYANTGTYLSSLRYRILWKQSDNTYGTAPDNLLSEHNIRILFNSESVAVGPLILTSDIIGPTGSVISNYSMLIPVVDPIYSYEEDWTLSVTDGKLTITDISGQFPETIYLSQNVLSIPEAYIPNRKDYYDWYVLLKMGSILSTDRILSTRYMATPSKPSRLYLKRKAKVIRPNIIQVPHRNFISNTVTLYVNGKEQSGIVAETQSGTQLTDTHHGYIQLSRPVNQSAVCEVSYEIESTSWAEIVSIDFNQKSGHSSHQSISDIGSATVSLYLTDIKEGTDALFGTGSDTGTMYSCTTGSRISTFTKKQRICSISSINSSEPIMVDIRKKGGGLLESYKDEVDWSSITDWGYLDGRPIENIQLIITLPDYLYSDIRSRYIAKGYDLDTASSYTDEYIRKNVYKYVPVGIDIQIKINNKVIQ